MAMFEFRLHVYVAHESPLGKYKSKSMFEFQPKKTCKKKASDFSQEKRFYLWRKSMTRRCD